MDKHGRKPLLNRDDLIITEKKGTIEHDPNNLHFEELFGIRVGQRAPSNLKIRWGENHVSALNCGLVICSPKSKQPFRRLTVDKQISSDRISSIQARVYDRTNFNYHELLVNFACWIEANYNVPSQLVRKCNTQKYIARFETTTLILRSKYYPGDNIYKLELYHNDVERSLERELAADGYTVSMDAEWDEDLWQSGRFFSSSFDLGAPEERF